MQRMHAQVGNENQAFLSKWIDSHAGACKAIGKPFVLEEFGKNVTAKAKTPEEWKARRTPMFSHAYSEYISSLESGGNYQGAALSLHYWLIPIKEIIPPLASSRKHSAAFSAPLRSGVNRTWRHWVGDAFLVWQAVVHS